jgi:hypothetical protein
LKILRGADKTEKFWPSSRRSVAKGSEDPFPESIDALAAESSGCRWRTVRRNVARLRTGDTAAAGAVAGRPGEGPLPRQTNLHGGVRIARGSRADLAKKLLADAEKTTADGDAALKFVLLAEARQAAVAAGDFDLAAKAVDAMAASYAVNREEMRASVVTAALASRGPASASAAPLAVDLLDGALRSDDYRDAAKWAAAAKSLAERSGD